MKAVSHEKSLRLNCFIFDYTLSVSSKFNVLI